MENYFMHSSRIITASHIQIRYYYGLSLYDETSNYLSVSGTAVKNLINLFS